VHGEYILGPVGVSEVGGAWHNITPLHEGLDATLPIEKEGLPRCQQRLSICHRVRYLRATDYFAASKTVTKFIVKVKRIAKDFAASFARCRFQL